VSASSKGIELPLLSTNAPVRFCEAERLQTRWNAGASPPAIVSSPVPATANGSQYPWLSRSDTVATVQFSLVSGVSWKLE
jgi:hypothetical protein